MQEELMPTFVVPFNPGSDLNNTRFLNKEYCLDIFENDRWNSKEYDSWEEVMKLLPEDQPYRIYRVHSYNWRIWDLIVLSRIMF